MSSKVPLPVWFSAACNQLATGRWTYRRSFPMPLVSASFGWRRRSPLGKEQSKSRSFQFRCCRFLGPRSSTSRKSSTMLIWWHTDCLNLIERLRQGVNGLSTTSYVTCKILKDYIFLNKTITIRICAACGNAFRQKKWLTLRSISIITLWRTLGAINEWITRHARMKSPMVSRRGE